MTTAELDDPWIEQLEAQIEAAGFEELPDQDDEQ
jgi:hypothetical protein